MGPACEPLCSCFWGREAQGFHWASGTDWLCVEISMLAQHDAWSGPTALTSMFGHTVTISYHHPAVAGMKSMSLLEPSWCCL